MTSMVVVDTQVLYMVREAEVDVPEGTDLDAVGYYRKLSRPVFPVRNEDGDHVHVGESVLTAGPGFRFERWHDGDENLAGALFARRGEQAFVFLSDGMTVRGHSVLVVPHGTFRVVLLVTREDGVRVAARYATLEYQESPPYRAIVATNGHADKFAFVAEHVDGSRELVHVLSEHRVVAKDTDIPEGHLAGLTEQATLDIFVIENPDGQSALFTSHGGIRHLTGWFAELRTSTVYTNGDEEVLGRVGNAWSVWRISGHAPAVRVAEGILEAGSPISFIRENAVFCRAIRDAEGTALLFTANTNAERLPVPLATLDVWQMAECGRAFVAMDEGGGRMRFGSFGGIDGPRIGNQPRSRTVRPVGPSFDRIMSAQFVDQFHFVAVVEDDGETRLVVIHDGTDRPTVHLNRPYVADEHSVHVCSTATHLLIAIRDEHGWWPSDGRDVIGNASFDRLVRIHHEDERHLGRSDIFRWCGIRGSKVFVAATQRIRLPEP